MKKLIILIILFSSYATAGTITSKELIGFWATPESLTLKDSIANWLFSPSINTLEIKNDYSIKLIRKFDNKTTQIFQSNSSNISFNDDITIVKFYDQSGLVAKLVISGWSNKSSKRIFGELYLYNNNDGLFNSLRVSFAPSKSS